MNEEIIIEKIIDICKRLNSKQMLASGDGNISYRLSNDQILITPTAVNKSLLQAEEMCLINMNGDFLKGKPSCEYRMHLAIYRKCQNAKCVVHAHPPVTVSWTIAFPELSELPCESLPEVILDVGKIPITKFVVPGSEDVANEVVKLIPEHKIIILARHGVVSWGETLPQAYNGIERVEHASIILKSALEIGANNPLPKKDVDILQQIRKNFLRKKPNI